MCNWRHGYKTTREVARITKKDGLKNQKRKGGKISKEEVKELVLVEVGGAFYCSLKTSFNVVHFIYGLLFLIYWYTYFGPSRPGLTRKRDLWSQWDLSVKGMRIDSIQCSSNCITYQFTVRTSWTWWERKTGGWSKKKKNPWRSKEKHRQANTAQCEFNRLNETLLCVFSFLSIFFLTLGFSWWLSANKTTAHRLC